MSKLSYKDYICKECGILMDPIKLASSNQHAYEISNNRLNKTKHVVAMCENQHIGVFPFYKNVKTYISKVKDGVSFFIDSTIWVEKYMDNPDSYGQPKSKNPNMKDSIGALSSNSLM